MNQVDFAKCMYSIHNYGNFVHKICRSVVPRKFQATKVNLLRA